MISTRAGRYDSVTTLHSNLLNGSLNQRITKDPGERYDPEKMR